LTELDQKYHSIAKSGKRLEDVLTKEELRELQACVQQVTHDCVVLIVVGTMEA
jgi:hypothetical protein